MRIAERERAMAPHVDVWSDLQARGLLLDLESRGVVLSVRDRHLVTDAADRLDDADRAQLRQHKPALLLLVLAASEQVLDRLEALRRGLAWPFAPQPGCCRSCGDALPVGVAAGACGWCTVAARQHRGAPLPLDLLELFPADAVGDYARARLGRGLRLDLGGAA